jgi:hypothetical protein
MPPAGGHAALVDADEEQPEQHGRDQGEQDGDGRAEPGDPPAARPGLADPPAGRGWAVPGRGRGGLVRLLGGERGHGDPGQHHDQAGQGDRSRPLAPGQVDQQRQHGPLEARGATTAVWPVASAW